MSDAIGAACVGAVIGWQVPVVRRVSLGAIFAAALEVAITAIPVYVVFGAVISLVALSGLFGSALVHRVWRVSIARRSTFVSWRGRA